MKIVCDSCGTKYSIADDKVRGKVFKIRCKKCSHIIVVRGGETGGPEAAAAPAADGGWHLVVDGEQVGPIPDADVRTKIERGEIKGETYTWKEGFADWVKLSAVPEFAGLVAEDVAGPRAAISSTAGAVAAAPVNGADRARRASGAGRSLFGGGGGASDVFAAPAASARSGRRRSVRVGGGDAAARGVELALERRGGGRARRRPRREPDRPAARELGPLLAFEPAVAGDAGAKPRRRPRRRGRRRRRARASSTSAPWRPARSALPAGASHSFGGVGGGGSSRVRRSPRFRLVLAGGAGAAAAAVEQRPAEVDLHPHRAHVVAGRRDRLHGGQGAQHQVARCWSSRCSRFRRREQPAKAAAPAAPAEPARSRPRSPRRICRRALGAPRPRRRESEKGEHEHEHHHGGKGQGERQEGATTRRDASPRRPRRSSSREKKPVKGSLDDLLDGAPTRTAGRLGARRRGPTTTPSRLPLRPDRWRRAPSSPA